MGKKIAIVGIGHIGRALTLGLLRGRLGPKDIILSNPDKDKIADLKAKYKVRTTEDNRKAVDGADIVIISVRPEVIESVVFEVNPFIREKAIIISVAIGVTFRLLDNYFDDKTRKIIRLMPNILVAYGKGVMGFLANRQVKARQIMIVKKLLSPLGLLIDCRDETHLDRLSMISGCGPGYIGYFMHNLEKLAVAYGFDKRQAQEIVKQLFIGTLTHMQFAGISSKKLVESVATKGGITEEVIDFFDKWDFYSKFQEGVEKGYAKIGDITKSLSGIKTTPGVKTD